MMNTAFNLSGDTDRTFAIDIAGSPHQAMLRSSAYTVKVAYSSLSKTLQSIGKRGGKVVNVRMLSTPMPSVDNIPVSTAVLISTEAATSPSTETVNHQQPGPRRSQSKSKKR
jgi:CpcD/allophycocyanin linker domain